MLDYMNVEDVARYLRVPVMTIRGLRQEGRFVPAIKVGKRLVWAQEDVRAWAEAQREPAS